MKFVIVFVSAILSCNAAPQLIYSALPWGVVPAVSQYHAQDALGQYSYGYSGGPSAKSEVKTLDGVTRGTYSYIDSNSKLQTVNYVADSLGFRVAATNLPTAPVDVNKAPVDSNEAPKQVEDTEAVKQARAEHLAAVAQAKSESTYEPEAPEAPEPVEDTEEVKQAREEHLQAVEEAKARNAIAPVDVSAPQVVQIAQPAAIHLAHPAWGPVSVVRSDLGPSFGYHIVG